MGQRLGTYTLERLVAQGGAGSVFLGRAPNGRPVAIKVLASLVGAPERIERALREARSLLRLDHPGVVRLLDVGKEANGAPYLVLEWVEGEHLGARLSREGPLAVREAAELVAGLAEALAHCHEREVLHRDLKPENVLLRTSDGAALLGDFSLALELDRSTRLTKDGRPHGTPGYWAPEQAFGQRDVIGPRTDVWGLGALLFAALTGRPPAEGADLPELLRALQRPIPAPSSLRHDVPTALDAICRRCLALDPAARFATADQVARELRSWLARSAERPRGRARELALLFGVAVAIGAGTFTVLWRMRVAESEQLAREAERLATAGDLEAAWRMVDQALALDPQGSRALAARGALRFARHDARGALADFEAALARDGESAPLVMRRGAALLELDRQDEAARELERALTLDPGLTDAWVARGVLRIRRGDQEGALADLSRAIELRPSASNALANRGNLRRTRGDLPGALADLDRALTIYPDDPDALGYRSATREQSGDPGGALRDVERAERLDPGNPNHPLNRARLLARFGRNPEALESCERALALDPRYARAFAVRGRTRAALGDFTAGLADMDWAIALDPARSGNWSDRATLRMIAGDAAGAVSDAKRAIELDPDDAEAHGVLGVDASNRDDLRAALAHLDRALEHSPGNVGIRRNRAVVRRGLGDTAGAIEDLERCVALDPANPEAPAFEAELERLRGDGR